jgi:thiol-disulfide isomerase/thioredoxin
MVSRCAPLRQSCGDRRIHVLGLGQEPAHAVAFVSNKEIVMQRILARLASVSLLLFTTSCFAAAKVGDAAPDVVLGVTSSGETAKVADYAGKVVVVSFWASWCTPCRQELPILEGLQIQGKGNIQVVAVNIESREVFKKASKLLGDLHLMLANDRSDRSQSAYGVKTIPHMVIIGRDGRILHIHKGYGEGSLSDIVTEINGALGVPAADSANNG